MNSRALVAGSISVVVFGIFLFKGAKDNDKVVQGVQSQGSLNNDRAAATLESQIKNMGAVEVEVTPINVDSNSNMIFDVSLNTHSVDLSFDYTKIISAGDDEGKTYKALSWSGGREGHHLSGQIELEPISQEVAEIKLIIDGIDNQNAVFEWEL